MYYNRGLPLISVYSIMYPNVLLILQSDEEGTTPINKRSHSVGSEEREDEQETSEKRPRLASNDSEGEGDDQDELEAELADLQPQEEDEVIVDESIPEGKKESSDSEVEDKK